MKYFLLLLLLVGLPLYYLRYGKTLKTPFDVAHYQEVYAHSQYCQPECEFAGNIDDPELYSLAGYYYLEGADPSSIAKEVQPLTKYLFGLSLHTWGNALPIQLFFGIGVMILLYYLASQLLSPKLSLLPPILLAIDPLFLDQLGRPFVDLSLTFWLLLVILYLSRGNYLRDALWGGVALGTLSLSKSFSLGVVVTAVIALVVYLYDRPRFWPVAIRLCGVALLSYILGYTMYFVHGHSLFDFLVLHIDTLRLYRGYVPEYPKGEIFRLIFSGQWRTWWGDEGTIASPFYTFAWPLGLMVAVSLITSRLYRHKAVVIHLLTIGLFLLFISSRLMFPRYLLPVLPSLYLLLVYGLSKLETK